MDEIFRPTEVQPWQLDVFETLQRAPLIVGIDFARDRSDMTAICIAEQLKDHGIRVVAMAERVEAMTFETVLPFINRLHRGYARPKGYSQSHWRKIYRDSPRMRPIDIVYDGVPQDGEETL